MVQRVVLCLLALATGASDSANIFMYRKLTKDRKLLRHPISQVNKLFRIVMPQTACLQVETDETTFGLSFQEELHMAHDVPPLVIGGRWSAIQGCKGFVIIASLFSAVPRLLQKLPRWAEHRILIILQDLNALQVAVMTDTEIFLDAEVALVSSSNLLSGYMLPQANRFYSPFNKSSPTWTRLKDGPTNFEGRTISVMTGNCSMFSQIGQLDSNGEPAWTAGAEMIMLLDIADRLNLKPKFNITKSLTAGWFQKPLNRSGGGTTDMAFCGILVSARSKSLKEIFMSQPLVLLCLKFLVPRPKERHDDWDGVFQPFNADTWFLTAITVFCTSFLLQRFTFITRRLVVTKGIKKYEKLGGSFLQILSILVLSNVPKSSKEQGAIRHILTWWSMFTLVMTTSFASSLVSHLTNQEFTEKIDTIQELIKNDYHWAMKINPEFDNLLDLNDPWQARWKYRFQRVYSTEQHILLIKKGKQALWGYEVNGGFALPDSDLPYEILKDFEVVSQCFMEYFIGYAIREGSPYELPINRYIRWYTEGGLVTAIMKRVHAERYLRNPYVYRVLRLTKSGPGRAMGLHLSHLTGIFTVWVIGTALAILVFLLEIAQKCWI